MATAPNLTESIAARLRNDILVGTYKAGERLPAERDLASRLGVNRGSVREALKKLEQMGLVVIRRGDGATVRHLHEASIEIVRHLLIVNGVVNRRLLEQVLDVHEMLVAGAAHLAVERGSPEDHGVRASCCGISLEPGVSDAERAALFDALVDVITQASGNLVVQLVRNVIRPALAERMARGAATARRAPAASPRARPCDRRRDRSQRRCRRPPRRCARWCESVASGCSPRSTRSSGARARRPPGARRRYRLCLSAAIRSSSGGCVMNRRAIPLRATPDTPNAAS